MGIRQGFTNLANMINFWSLDSFTYLIGHNGNKRAVRTINQLKIYITIYKNINSMVNCNIAIKLQSNQLLYFHVSHVRVFATKNARRAALRGRPDIMQFVFRSFARSLLSQGSICIEKSKTRCARRAMRAW